MGQILRLPFILLLLALGLAATYELVEAYGIHTAADALFRVQVAMALYLAALWTGTLMSLVPVLPPAIKQ